MSQGLLFSDPSIAETGVWCELADGIDPAEWASLCRFLGSLGPREFGAVRRKILPNPSKKLFDGSSSSSVGIPLVSLGPSGIGGEYQREG